MNERLITLLGGLVALAAVVLLLAPPKPVEPGDGSVPTSVDEGPQGLAALRQWLSGAGIPVLALRDRYPALLTDPELPGSGNLLISVLPHRDSSRPEEREHLQHWVAQGNAVLFLTALSDWPAWATGTDRDVFALPGQFGFEPAALEGDEDEAKGLPALPERRERILRAARTVPFLQGIGQVKAHWLTSEQPEWRLDPTAGARAVLVLLTDDLGAPAFWQLRTGQGRVWMSRHAELFNNAKLGAGDNAAFAARLVQAALGPGGRVIFDDRHHGITTVYDPDAFYQDARLHNTLWFLFALWVIYLLGHTNRFAAPAAAGQPMSLAAETRAIGGFLARRVRPQAVARRLLEHFHNEVRGSLHLPRNGQPAWGALESHAGIDPRLLQQARKLAQRSEDSQSVDLRELVNTLKSIKDKLK